MSPLHPWHPRIISVVLTIVGGLSILLPLLSGETSQSIMVIALMHCTVNWTSVASVTFCVVLVVFFLAQVPPLFLTGALCLEFFAGKYESGLTPWHALLRTSSMLSNMLAKSSATCNCCALSFASRLSLVGALPVQGMSGTETCLSGSLATSCWKHHTLQCGLGALCRLAWSWHSLIQTCSCLANHLPWTEMGFPEFPVLSKSL